jgi:hypothetical protein
MKSTQLSMEPLTNRLTVTHKHRTDQRIRADSPATALGKLQRPPQVSTIRVCQLGIHATD